MDKAKLMQLAIGTAILYAAYKYLPGGAVKNAMVLGVAGTLAARNIPYINQYLA